MTQEQALIGVLSEQIKNLESMTSLLRERLSHLESQSAKIQDANTRLDTENRGWLNTYQQLLSDADVQAGQISRLQSELDARKRES
jgi:SMC interacting uncharacterized protein involved in chromosome segregation